MRTFRPPTITLIGSILVALLMLVTKQPLASDISDSWNYTDARGLPLGPTTTSMSIADLIEIIDEDFPEIMNHLLITHEAEDRVKLFESYSSVYPVYLENHRIIFPLDDGVMSKQLSKYSEPEMTGEGRCLSPYFECEQVHFPKENDQPYDVIVLVGWKIELIADFITGGSSLIIVSESFSSNGFTINTSPTGYKGEPPEETVEPDGRTRAAAGRHGEDGGLFVLYTNVFEALQVVTEGLEGELGNPGIDAIGEVTKTRVYQPTFGDPPQTHPKYWEMECLEFNIEPGYEAGHGGAGGDGGNGGPVLIGYTSVFGPYPDDWDSYSNEEFDCSNSRFFWNPSLSICDLATESNNSTCSDGVDNDGDGLIDCNDPDCHANPFVSICPRIQSVDLGTEFSPEDCTDGIDNDGDGYVDHNDLSCHWVQETDGTEESTNETCSNGRDDDHDGFIDCEDPECRYNSLVTVCETENNLIACSDGIDNDGDNLIDCNDPGCKGNPYVRLCEPHQNHFLKESNPEACSDGIDNDNDGFIDCDDYQCQNNQLASDACGSFENTLEECTDGIDNDGDGRVDCGDANCYYNPFFGELLCKGDIKTYHPELTLSTFSGIDVKGRFNTNTKGAVGGRGGRAGARVGAHKTKKWTQWPCEFYDEPCSGTLNLSCVVGLPASDGERGDDGKDGIATIEWKPRQRVDLLRSLLSPRSWVVRLAEGNTFFKRNESKSASFTYLQTLARLYGVLGYHNLTCNDNLSSASPAAKILLQTVCPTLSRIEEKATLLAAGLDYYGNSVDQQINPRNRYGILRSRFDVLFDELNQNILKWIQLSSAIEIWNIQETELNKLEVDIADILNRKEAAQGNLQAAQAGVTNLEAMILELEGRIASTKQQLEIVEGVIKDKYENDFDDFVLDLGKSIAKHYAFGFGDALLDATISETISTEKTTESKEKAGFFTKALNKTSVTDALKSGTKNVLKKYDQTDENGDYLWSVLTGNYEPNRSVLAYEIDRAVLNHTQKWLTLEYLDRTLALNKAKYELLVAQLERNALIAHERNLRQLSSRLNEALNNNELSVLDKILLGRQAYEMAIDYVERLTEKYTEILHQVRYEYTPFSPSSGEVLSPVLTYTDFDFNLVNYGEMIERLAELDEAINLFQGSKRAFFYRWPVNPFADPDERQMGDLATIGLTPDELNSPVVVELKIDGKFLRNHAKLGSLKRHRVRDVRITIYTHEQLNNITVYVVRNPYDAFVVGRPNEETEWIAGFELVHRDLNYDGSEKSTLHFQSMEGCVSPPPDCELGDEGCITEFAVDLLGGSCRLSGGIEHNLPETNTFWDRSLIGNWMFVIPDQSLLTLGQVEGMEIVIEIVAID